jgi:hypothetical protein
MLLVEYVCFLAQSALDHWHAGLQALSDEVYSLSDNEALLLAGREERSNRVAAVVDFLSTIAITSCSPGHADSKGPDWLIPIVVWVLPPWPRSRFITVLPHNSPVAISPLSS